MIEEKVQIRNIVSNYKLSGSGEPILILHGWGGSSDSWDETRKILSANGYRIISPDFPGFGKSANPNFAWNLDDYLDWTMDFVDYVGLEKFHLFGHSFGGRMAVKLATKYPERVNKLILCDPAGLKVKTNLKTKLILAFAEVGTMLLRPKFLRKLREFSRDLLFSFIKKRDYVQADSLMQNVMKKVLAEDLFPILPLIKNETLCIWGSEDKVIPLRYAYVFRDNIKDCEVSIIKGVGHSPQLEAVVPVCEAIDQFLKK